MPCCQCTMPHPLRPPLDAGRAHAGVTTVVPQVWVSAVGIAGSSSDDQGTEIDTGPDITTPRFFWPYSEKFMGEHGWAFARTSAGYAWGEGFTGTTNSSVRICLIGAQACTMLG